jgi:hypothetical protein
MAQAPRLNPDDRFVLTLDGVVCGEVIAAEGGDISSPVIREPDAGGLVRKHLGPAEPRPVELTLDLSLQPVVYDWIASAWQGEPLQKNGTLVSVDSSLRARSEFVFQAAVIESTSFPAVDAASHDPGTIAVTLRPQHVALVAGSGQPVPGLVPKPKQTGWLSSNFLLQIGGLDCKRVSSVYAAPIDRSTGVIDFPDLKIELAETGAGQWDAWHAQFVEQPAEEKSGTLTFLGQDLKTPLGSVTLTGLGIYRVTAATSADDRHGAIRRLAAELYCQEMSLSVPA